jgi:acetyl-CoA acetyltransferase
MNAERRPASQRDTQVSARHRALRPQLIPPTTRAAGTLKLTTADAIGGTITQTITHAYSIRRFQIDAVAARSHARAAITAAARANAAVANDRDARGQATVRMAGLASLTGR